MTSANDNTSSMTMELFAQRLEKLEKKCLIMESEKDAALKLLQTKKTKDDKMAQEPKKKADYSHTVVYKLRSKNRDIKDDYIGHSKTFIKRKYHEHKYNCNNTSEILNTSYFKVYVFIRENGGYDNWEFEILERANLNDKHEAATLERYWIEKLEPSLNERLPELTPDERTENRIKYCRVWSKKGIARPY
jgi:hypothetical protein